MSTARSSNFGRGIPPQPGGVGWGTWSLLAIAAVPYLIAWLFLRGTLVQLFGLDWSEIGRNPWSILTFPLASMGAPGEIISVLFTCLWSYWVGRSLEKDTGPGLLVGIFGVLTLASSVAWILGSLVVGANPLLAGVSLPLAALTVIWAMRNPEHTILLMMIVPVKAKYLAVITAVVTLFTAGGPSPLMGVFALLPLLLGFLYATNRIPGLRFGTTPADSVQKKKSNEEFRRFQDEVRKKEKEREERERLRKLFEASLIDDKDKDR